MIVVYEDEVVFKVFVDVVDVIIYEFENILILVLDIFEVYCLICPGCEVLCVSQDCIMEKDFLIDLGLKIVFYVQIDIVDDLVKVMIEIGMFLILKICCFGYDGKGQVCLLEDSDLVVVMEEVVGVLFVLEGFVNFSYEVLVIVVCGIMGEVVCFDSGENVYEGGILCIIMVLVCLSGFMCMDVVLMVSQILNVLDYVGVLGVEFFVIKDGFIVNEIVLCVYNFGYWIQNGCVVDQFE